MTKKGEKEFSIPYTKLATFYDRLMNKNKYTKWKKLISKVINRYNIPANLCIDLACGTGNISKIMIDLGFKVVGFDKSPEMIKVAQKKVPKGQYFCSNLNNFELPTDIKNKTSLAVSFYDSLNYILTTKELLQVFKAIYNNIPSSAIFLFDMNTTEHVKEAQKFETTIYNDNDCYCIFRYGGKNKLWILDIDIFIKEDLCYRLVNEQHKERGYDRKEIESLLNKAGFNLMEVQKDYKTSKDKKYLSRLYFVAKKP